MAEIVDVLESLKVDTDSKSKLLEYQVEILMESFPNKLHISQQRLKDIQLELRRLQVMVIIIILYLLFKS